MGCEESLNRAGSLKTDTKLHSVAVQEDT